MKPEALEESDSRRKNQCSRKGKRQGAEVDLPFVLIIRQKKAQQEQDRRPCSHAPTTAKTSRGVRKGRILPTRLMAMTERSAAR